ncbi:hypothetical protein JDV02_000632 [Purpureocillium takamizusanense]|uniref:Uncharacterized protein n=1 Tax=Purpureocillium takamizusanense TaxID=2060973 RepID=A0A9Q8Q6K2_9HYPO|nr:uncharacterized protein JDV02_000632 [Purpureocillium takamizusanense]UNI13945.1 hypothetical protein JDV02_000632 [Purpureocillium takamizusanense]
MRFTNIALAVATTAIAQRPSDTPICDYYTKALLKENNATNQATLLTLLVNTVVIGNYTMPNTGVMVPGILAKGMQDGQEVNLLPYFTGGLKSTNKNGQAASVNFLDGGGAEPLKKNMPANDKSSRQYFLLTHLYQFFGSLLGCSMQGMTGFDAYMGHTSMYEVHKFMGLGKAEMDYFIAQVAMAAKSFGVADDDIKAVGEALNNAFNMRCAAPTAVLKTAKPELQAICIADDCTKAKNATCDAYAKVMKPEPVSSPSSSSSMMMSSMTASSSMMMPTGTQMSGSMTGTMMPTGTSMPTSVPTAGAGQAGLNIAAAAAGILAFVL